jgi:hypothetical protein
MAAVMVMVIMMIIAAATKQKQQQRFTFQELNLLSQNINIPLFRCKTNGMHKQLQVYDGGELVIHETVAVHFTYISGTVAVQYCLRYTNSL